MNEEIKFEPTGKTGSDGGTFAVSRWGWSCLAITTLFVLLQIALGMIAAPDAIMNHSPDLTSWLDPAKALLAHGDFVELQDPTKRQVHRPPLYSLYLAGAMTLSDQHWTTFVVAGQAAMLFVTGLIVRHLAEMLLAGSGIWAFALTIFNPNAFAAAHLMQSENLYGLFLLLAVAAALAFARRPGPGLAAGCAAAAAAACLTRPGLAPLAYAMPIGLLVLGMVARPKARVSTTFTSAFTAAAVLIALLSPWMWHNARGGHGFVVTPAVTQNYYLRDLAAHLEMYTTGRSFSEARQKLDNRREASVAGDEQAWAQKSERQRQEETASWYKQQLLGYPLTAWLKAVGLSVITVMLSPGSGQLIGLLDLPGTSAMAAFESDSAFGYLGAWWTSAQSRSFWGLLVIAATGLFVGLVRIFNVVGVIHLLWTRHYATLITIVLVIGYQAGNTLIYGTARYRLPVDSLLMLLAALGIGFLRGARRNAQRRLR